jgi:O-antigen/teichoic acid export membrane protein
LRKTLLSKSLILILGTGVAQALPILALPLLARYYSPESFNFLALFISVSAILSILSTGRYELAILKPKFDRTAFSIFALSAGISVCFALLVWGVTGIILMVDLEFLYQNKFTTTSLLLLPLGIMNYGLIQVISYWFSRKDKFKLTSYLKVIQSLIVVGLSLLLGILGFKLNGLVIAFAAGGLFVALCVAFILFSRRGLINMRYIKKVAVANNDFPKFLMFSALLDTFATQAPVLFLSAHFNAFQVGSYSFASRIVTAPVSLLGGSIAQAYLQTFSKLLNEGRKIYNYFIKTVFILSILSVFILGILFMLAPALFEILFDPQWELAGKIASFLALAMIPRFIVAPVSASMIALESMRMLTFWQVLYTITTASFFYVFNHLSLLEVVSFYYLHEFALYTIYFIFIRKAVKKHHQSKN